MTARPRICVFGLGEAGSLIAGDLAEIGADVHGYDPAGVATPAGVTRHTDARDAARHAEVVLGITAGADATTALTQALDTIPAGAVYADLATASPGLERQLETLAVGAGLGFVDVALMAPVPGNGLHTPALASGPAATAFVAAMAPLGMPVEYAGEAAGQATTRKLLRSVVMKGLAALVVESLRAAEAAGLAEETWRNIVAQITVADEALLRRLVAGTATHAGRRAHEMEATADLLAELGVEPTMTLATTAQLRVAASDPSSVPTPPT